MSQANNPTRNGKKWSVNETLRLQREYELLEWTVDKIAEAHQRTGEAIVFRLHKEGFIDELEDARGYTPTNSCENAKTEFLSYIDDILSENRMTLEEIQTCFFEKIESLTKVYKKKHVSLRKTNTNKK